MKLGGCPSHLGSRPELTVGGTVGLKTKLEIKNPVLKSIWLSWLLQALIPVGKYIVIAARVV